MEGALLSHALSYLDSPGPQTLVLLHLSDQAVPLLAFINSGTDSEFMDEHLVRELKLPTQPLNRSILVRALDNHVIHSCSLRTDPIHISIDNHQEVLSFLILHL